MSIIEKKSETTFILKVNVKPNVRNKEIIIENGYVQIKLTSKPIHNKANRELVKLLKKKLKINQNQIHIISGLKSTSKLIEITYNEKIDEEGILTKLIS